MLLPLSKSLLSQNSHALHAHTSPPAQVQQEWHGSFPSSTGTERRSALQFQSLHWIYPSFAWRTNEKPTSLLIDAPGWEKKAASGKLPGHNVKGCFQTKACRWVQAALHWDWGRLPRETALSRWTQAQRKIHSYRKEKYTITMGTSYGMLPSFPSVRVYLCLTAVAIY